MAVNVTLAVVKIVFGGLVGSIALVADGFHSLSDLATDAAVLAGIYFGSKEPDPEHPYGHGRAETFSAGFIALSLIFVGSAMTYYAVSSIHQWHKLRTRTVGREVFIDLHILVDPDLNVVAAHEIAEVLENTFHKQIARPVNITIHIEPDIPALRK